MQDLRQPIIDGLKAAIASAKAAGNTQEADRLQHALDYQLDDNAPSHNHTAAPGREPAAPPFKTRHITTAIRSGSQHERASKYNRENCVAAHVQRTPPMPSKDAPLGDQLAWVQTQRTIASDYILGFSLRAKCANTNEAREADQQDMQDWQAHRKTLTRELQRIRKAIERRNAN